MRKIFPVLLATIAISTSAFSAEIDTQDISMQNLTPDDIVENPKGPFTINIGGDYIWPAAVNNCHSLGDVTFATAIAEMDFIYYYDACYEEGAAVGLMFEETYLKLSTNPYFSQTSFPSASLILSVFTERVEDWQWKSQIAINFDDLPYWNFSNYMTYDIVAWGRYSWVENFGMHIGFFVQTGMKYDRVYPILGIDWEYNSRWKLNLIFPMDISAIYTIDDAWSLVLAGRFITQRHRTKKDEPVPEAFWAYQTSGGELALNYVLAESIKANIHAGCTLGGHLTIRNHGYSDPRRLRLNPAPYAGAEIFVNF